jgi:hypothetical protein
MEYVKLRLKTSYGVLQHYLLPPPYFISSGKLIELLSCDINSIHYQHYNLHVDILHYNFTFWYISFRHSLNSAINPLILVWESCDLDWVEVNTCLTTFLFYRVHPS